MSLFDAFFQLFDIRTVLAFAQLFLNRLDLLVQVVVALALFHLLFHTAANTLLDLQDVNFAFQLRQQAFQTLQGLGRFQHALLLFQLQRQMRSDGVSQAAGIINPGQGSQNFLRDFFIQFDVLLELAQHRTAQGFGFSCITGVAGHFDHRGHEVSLGILYLGDSSTLQAFHQHFYGAVGQLEHLQNTGRTRNFVEILGSGIILACGLLRHQHNVVAGLHCQLKSFNRARPTNKKRNHHVREHHYIAQGKQRQLNRFRRKNLARRHSHFL